MSKDKIISPKFMQVNPKTKVPQFSVISTCVFIMIVVLLFDISFLAQFISISTLATYCLIMSIIIYKKAQRKRVISVLMIVLFVLSMIFGFGHSMSVNDYFTLFVLAVSVAITVMIFVEHKYYPDKEGIKEEILEA